MSSAYRFLCLAHDPAIEVGESIQLRDVAVGLAERRDDAPELAEHRGCRLLVGRYSYPLVELYDPRTRQWVDIDVIRLLIAARAAGVADAALTPFARRGWDTDTLARLSPHLEDS